MIDWGLHSVCSAEEWPSHFDKNIMLKDGSLTANLPFLWCSKWTNWQCEHSLSKIDVSEVCNIKLKREEKKTENGN